MVAAIKGNIRDASDGKPKCIENLYSYCSFIFSALKVKVREKNN